MKVNIHQGDLGPMAYIILSGAPGEIEEQLATIDAWLVEQMPNGGFNWFERDNCLRAIEQGKQFETKVMAISNPLLKLSMSDIPFFLVFDTEEAAVLFKVWMDG
jgi:hypothetical protein